MDDLVSVVIATHNRFNDLIRAIESVKNQTYKNIEIIVVNDCSTDERYYTTTFSDIIYISLPESTKNVFGFPCPGYTRTVGIRKATGRYVAFLDDDDIWFPNKLEIQLNEMKNTGCKMSTTDSYWDFGLYDTTKSYKLFYSEIFLDEIKHIHRNANSNILNNGFPTIWKKPMIDIHNACMTSSVVIEKTILEKINYMKFVRIGQEDWDCWKNALNYTDCVFINKPLVYYTRRA